MLEHRRMMMKKTYNKPLLICEDLQPETMLCGCDVSNPEWSDLEMCGYPISIPGTSVSVRLFGENWNDCDMNSESLAGTDYYMCFYGPSTSIFSS